MISLYSDKNICNTYTSIKNMDKVNTLINWLSSEQTSNNVKNLSENQIINIANNINTLLSQTNMI